MESDGSAAAHTKYILEPGLHRVPRVPQLYRRRPESGSFPDLLKRGRMLGWWDTRFKNKPSEHRSAGDVVRARHRNQHASRTAQPFLVHNERRRRDALLNR
jgi:hypothetical protein